MLLVWEKKKVFIFWGGFTKKMIKWIKYMLRFRDILAIGSHLMWAPYILKEESYIFLRKKIVSSEISAIGLTQMDFNRR